MLREYFSILKIHQLLWSIFFLQVVFIFGLTMPIASATGLVINTTGKAPLNNKDRTGFLDLVSIEAFARIGLDIATIQLPAERGLVNANRGIDDGEMSRIAGLQKKYPNLLPVPEKIMDWEFVVFTKQEITLTNGWESLKPYSVSIINGWKILERSVPRGVELTKVNNPQQLFELLEKDRTDLIIYERWSGLETIRKNNFNKIKLMEPPLASKEMFIYLHKKHESVIPKLRKALHDMKQDGTYQNLVRKTLR